ncbi:MAG: hypothetical protein K0A92_02520, partial [Methyloprofundus sp.]|nr:hypothetical protein [Methyloprofundus sp.]
VNIQIPLAILARSFSLTTSTGIYTSNPSGFKVSAVHKSYVKTYTRRGKKEIKSEPLNIYHALAISEPAITKAVTLLPNILKHPVPR